jgi:hypothetical protein
MVHVNLRELVEAAEPQPIAETDGKSGATLERAVLADGRRVIVKRFDAETDLVMRVLGDDHGFEVDHWLNGIFDRLPADVGHAVLGGWFGDDGAGVLVMRDLGDAVYNWNTRVTAVRCRTMLRSVTSLHRAFHEDPPADLAPLDRIVGLFEPGRIGQYPDELVGYALRGWEHWAELVTDEVGTAVLALAQDTSPLKAALTRRPLTMVHGDLATVNMAFEGDRLTLIDWGLASQAPGALDIGRFLAGCAHVLDVDPDTFLAMYREEAGDIHDEVATRLGVLAGLVWLGWNKTLDIAEHPDESVREREKASMTWWLDRAREALDKDL